MKHIVERCLGTCGEYDSHTLELTSDDYYHELEPFLLSLGIKSRVCSSECVNGVWMVEIQAENPYKFWCRKDDRKNADDEFTPFRLSCYKR